MTASKKGASRRQSRIVAAVSVVALVAVSLGIVAWSQRGAALRERNRAEEQTRIARSQVLAGDARANMGDQIDLAALLSLEAQEIAETPAAAQAIHVAAQRTSWLNAFCADRRRPCSRSRLIPSARWWLLEVSTGRSCAGILGRERRSEHRLTAMRWFRVSRSVLTGVCSSREAIGR